MLVFRIFSFQGATIRPIVLGHYIIVIIVHHQIFFCAPVQNLIELFSTFLDESRKGKPKI